MTKHVDMDVVYDETKNGQHVTVSCLHRPYRFIVVVEREDGTSTERTFGCHADAIGMAHDWLNYPVYA